MSVTPDSKDNKKDKHTTVDSLIVNDIIIQLKQLLAGGLSGASTRFLTQPLDVIKIRFQLQVEPLSKKQKISKYNSVIQATKVIYNEEGFKGLWRGHNVGQVMSITYAMTQFWAYERFKNIHHIPWLQNHAYFTEFTAGALAGVVGSMVSMPFDVVRTRIVAQDPGRGYRNMAAGLVTLAREEGIRGCFRGAVPTVVQIIPMMGGNFLFYNIFVDFYKRTSGHPHDFPPTYINLLCGAAAGGLAKAISYPADFIRKRVQMQGFESHRKTFGKNQGCSGIRNCIMLTFREEGPLGFYKGLWPTLLKASAAAALFFGLYDLYKHLLI